MDSLLKQGFQKFFSILQKPKKLSNGNILSFVTAFNPHNRNICSTIKFSVIYLKNNVSGFPNINLIQSKHQPPISKNF